MKIQTCALAVLFMMAAVLYAKKENVHQRSIKEPLRFCTAEDFWQMNDSDRELYASGLVDGFLAIGFFNAPDEEVTWVHYPQPDHEHPVERQTFAEVLEKAGVLSTVLPGRD